MRLRTACVVRSRERSLFQRPRRNTSPCCVINSSTSQPAGIQCKNERLSVSIFNAVCSRPGRPTRFGNVWRLFCRRHGRHCNLEGAACAASRIEDQPVQASGGLCSRAALACCDSNNGLVIARLMFAFTASCTCGSHSSSGLVSTSMSVATLVNFRDGFLLAMSLLRTISCPP